jgi:hypothetical protein
MLVTHTSPCYIPAMTNHPDQAKPPQEWLDALARSEADLIAGRTAPWSEVRARLLAALDNVESEATHLRA